MDRLKAGIDIAGERITTLSREDATAFPSATTVEGIQLGNTRCLTDSHQSSLARELGTFDQIVRIVGGIPSKHVMARAIAELTPALAPLSSTAFLIGCTQTFTREGQTRSSIPGEGLRLQEEISKSTSDSRVYGTIPGRVDTFDGEKLLLRDRGSLGYQTYMHPALQHAILLSGAHKNEWLNEAHGTIELAEELLKNNPQRIYRALFIGGGEATHAELTRSVDLSRKFPEQVQIVLAWDSGGVTQKAAARRLTLNTHRIILERAAIHEALKTPVRGGKDRTLVQNLATLTGQRAYHESRGAMAPNHAEAQTPTHLVRRSSHLLAETGTLAFERVAGEKEQRSYRENVGTKLLKGFERSSHAAARSELDIPAEWGGSIPRHALQLLVAETIRAQRTSKGAVAKELPSDLLGKHSALSQIPSGSVVSISGMRYALVNHQSGEAILVHRRGNAAITDPITTLLPGSLAGERVEEIGFLADESLTPGALSTVPLLELRWSAITPGTRVVYSGIDDRQPIAVDEILSINPSPRGTHAKLVTCLRVTNDGSPATLISEERIETSLVIPPKDLASAHTVQVYRNHGLSSEPFTGVLLRERPESLRTAQLRRAFSAVFDSALLSYQDHLDSAQLFACADRREIRKLFTPEAYERYVQEMIKRSEEHQRLCDLFERWCSALDSSSDSATSGLIHAMTQGIERHPAINSTGCALADDALQRIKEACIQAPRAIRELEITTELLSRVGKLQAQVRSTIPGVIQTFRGSEINHAVLSACAKIAESRVISPSELPTQQQLAKLFERGGFLYSEYTSDYLMRALESGATLITASNPASESAQPVAFSLLHDAKTLPPNLHSILPTLRQKNHGYSEVLAADKITSTPLANLLLSKSTMGRAALRGADGLAAITNVYNQTVQNLLLKAGFTRDPTQRVSLASPAGGGDGKYRLYTRSFMRADTSFKGPVRGVAPTYEGYLTSRPEEFRQMSSLAASLGEQPITWFSFGVDSLTGDNVQAVKEFIVASRLSELEGVATYIPTKTIVRLPHSSGEPVQWRIDEENGAGVVESLLKNRPETQTTVGLALFDPADSLANQRVSVLTPDGLDTEFRVMRGNGERRTVYNYDLCNHALKFRVSFPSEIENRESIWGLGNYRALEFLTFFQNRMCIFAGGGTTVLRGIMQAAQTAIEQRQGKTTIVLLRGTGGMTDHATEKFDEMFAELSKEEFSQFLEFVIVDVRDGADVLRDVLRQSGRLS